MKKTVIVNGKAKRIEFSYAVGETISLSNTEVKKPWGRVTERVTVSKLTFTINGKTYEGTRTFKVAGGPYSETFEFDGNSFASHKKAIEYILNNIEMSETTIYKEGFNAGFMQLRQIDVEAATKELWQALGINNRNTFAAYKFGRIEPKASQAVAVELVFRKYGVTTNIWGK